MAKLDGASCPRRRASSGGAADGLDSRLRGNDGVAFLEVLSFGNSLISDL
ncbi:MAG: hypothetical protein WD069_00005 [Planctomycetales bacterium]